MGIKIGFLISGNGSNLQANIDACEAEKIDGKVVFVGSDRPNVFGLERADRRRIPNFVVNYSVLSKFYREKPEKRILPAELDFADILRKQSIFPENMEIAVLREHLLVRASIESELLKEINKFPFDVLALAGFMRNLSPYIIDKINIDPNQPRIMNIHPALLPAFPGTDGYGDTFAYGCKVGGCTVHFVDYGEDSGPIIGQRTYPIYPGDTLEAIKTRGLAEEWLLYPECLQLFAEGRLRIVERDIGKGKVKKVVSIVPSGFEIHNHPPLIKP